MAETERTRTRNVSGLLALVVLAFVVEALARGMTLERSGVWVGVVLTLGIFSFVYGDNRIYRFIEHLVIGSLAAKTFYVTAWAQVLRPKFYEPAMRGLREGTAEGLWGLLIIPGLFWYFALSKRFQLPSRLVIGFFVGTTAGLTFQTQIAANAPQVIDIVNLFGGGRGIIFSVLFLVSVVSVLFYFVFSLQATRQPTAGLHRLARVLMMVAFGVLFGNTVATRLSWLLDRVQYLLVDWLGVA
ncbi:MAG: hypothetical protein AB1486_22655 [Planctomycetota bacterium]